ncbi:hypothetical protein Nepgr_001201 [Nepenthes gracilis]|uniref:Membrane-associated kinase regulator 4 n=1 Tax=Nepenthes gracilis TaxID=150966 RepID=A0AAD3P852_NEPGR|nr:hypothetical protein Nepgr_001201 [Nepenthes gracilis]
MAAGGKEEEEEEDYIDMEITSYPSFLPQSPREFEFQMSSVSLDRELPTTSPADELFYKGKLLPLHLPPRLQMVEKLLQRSTSNRLEHESETPEEWYSTPLATTATATPFESCNISPSDSCQLSRELDPVEYFLGYSNSNSSEEKDFVSCETHVKKYSWTRKLKLIKQSSLASKLKSMFGKSGCGDESSAKSKEERISSKASECLKKGGKEDEAKGGRFRFCHRRSFSGAFKRQSIMKLSSSSSSSAGSSSSSNDQQGLKRSSSANTEMEISVQGAIAHCKQSQQVSRSRRP